VGETGDVVKQGIVSIHASTGVYLDGPPVPVESAVLYELEVEAELSVFASLNTVIYFEGLLEAIVHLGGR
jgi:hypothetical protein